MLPESGQRRRSIWMALALVFLLSIAVALGQSSGASTYLGASAGSALDLHHGSAAGFARNVGQLDSTARYYAQGPSLGLYFMDDKVVLDLARGARGQVLELHFLDARGHPSISARGRLTGKLNYLNGDRRYTDISTYGELRYRELWPGIDMVFKARPGSLKYEFLVRPGADPSRIRLAYAGASGLSAGAAGELRIQAPLGVMTDAKPRSHQLIVGRKVNVSTRYSVAGNDYGFEVGSYDSRRSLLIDPALVYSTYLGGADNDFGEGVAVDGADNAYVVGATSSSGFPTTLGAYDRTANGWSDVFVTKVDTSGALVYSTYLGGSGGDTQSGIAVDGSGNAYIAGYTDSSDFPTTVGTDRTLGGVSDAYVAKLDSTGSNLLYSTYLGGSDVESLISGLAIDQTGHAFVTGQTSSTDFPLTPGAPDTSNDNGRIDGFVTKLSDTGKSLLYSTYLGGGADEVAKDVVVDGSGNAYIVGQTTSADFPTTIGAFDTTYSGSFEDGFVTKVNAAGASFAYSTLLGGSGVDDLTSVGVSAGGNAYVTGWTCCTGDYPTTPGSFQPVHDGGDGLVTQLNTAGSGIVYSTFVGSFGGGAGTQPTAIALDSSGSAYVTGTTGQGIPVTPGAVDSTGNAEDAFLLRLTPAGDDMAYGTYLGGSSSESGAGIALDSTGDAILTGGTASSDFPTTPAAPQTTSAGAYDAFVTKVKPRFTYTQPVGASPFRSSLVPAFAPCLAPTANAGHGPPLSVVSCSPPAPASSLVAVGPRSLGFVRLIPLGSSECAPFDSSRCYPDVTLRVSVTDVRQGSPTGPDYDTPSAQDLALTQTLLDSGGAQGDGLRITDLNNRTGSGTAFDEAGTVVPLRFPVSVSCSPTVDTTIGSACNVQTTANTLFPGAAAAGKRAVWELGQFQVLDQGTNGVSGDSDDKPFEVQGVFVP